MPQYASTIMFIFILGSCVYKKHIRDWWWFRAGVVCLLVGIAIGGISTLFFSPFGGIGGSDFLRRLVEYIGTLTQIAAFGAFVFACIKNVEATTELRCPQCNYILRGISEPRCPECGWQI